MAFKISFFDPWGPNFLFRPFTVEQIWQLF